MRFYCPQCWSDFAEDFVQCPQCKQDVRKLLDSKDFAGKLILALEHPEQETVIRAAWILGKTRELRAVAPLMALLDRTQDVYIATAAVVALGQIGTPEAIELMKTVQNHPARMVRDTVLRILQGGEFDEGRDPIGSSDGDS